MHEVGMCEGVVAAVERRAEGRPVARVGVRVGASLRVVPEAFQQAFELVAAGGVAEGAEAIVTMVPARGRCGDCGAEAESTDPLPVCATCGSVAIAWSGGNELVLEWVEYREAAAEAAGRT
jgi:hydrogenase nickel incorporation protein HypA/HybF